MPERPIRTIIEHQDPIVASSDMTVAAAARLMKLHRIGALLVTDAGRLAEVMTANPRSLAPDRTFAHALHLMHEGEFRHVPVVENGRPLGMVSARDALGPDLKQFIADLETRTHVGEILG